MRKNNSDFEESSERARFLGFLIRFSWIVILASISWWIASWLLFETDVLSMRILYRQGMPREWPEEVIMIIVTGIVFLVLNLLVWIGYFAAVPSGRRRPNRASTYSRNPETY